MCKKVVKAVNIFRIKKAVSESQRIKDYFSPKIKQHITQQIMFCSSVFTRIKRKNKLPGNTQVFQICIVKNVVELNCKEFQLSFGGLESWTNPLFSCFYLLGLLLLILGGRVRRKINSDELVLPTFSRKLNRGTCPPLGIEPKTLWYPSQHSNH